jgi:hypothetical protein
MTRSLSTALAFAVVIGALWAAAFHGWMPPEPWDVYAFALLSVGAPLAALATTLAFVAKELPRPWGSAAGRTSPWWQSVSAAVLSFALFLAGGVLFLAPFQH